ELPGAGRAELAHQAGHRVPGEREAGVELGDGEPRRRCRQPDVAARREDDGAADRQPIDRRDRHLVQALEEAARALADADAQAPVEVVARLVGAPLPQVGAPRERAPSAGQDHDARLDIVLQRAADLLQFFVHAQVDAVELVRPVERDRREAGPLGVALEGDRFHADQGRQRARYGVDAMRGMADDAVGAPRAIQGDAPALALRRRERSRRGSGPGAPAPSRMVCRHPECAVTRWTPAADKPMVESAPTRLRAGGVRGDMDARPRAPAPHRMADEMTGERQSERTEAIERAARVMAEALAQGLMEADVILSADRESRAQQIPPQLIETLERFSSVLARLVDHTEQLAAR